MHPLSGPRWRWGRSTPDLRCAVDGQSAAFRHHNSLTLNPSVLTFFSAPPSPPTFSPHFKGCVTIVPLLLLLPQSFSPKSNLCMTFELKRQRAPPPPRLPPPPSRPPKKRHYIPAPHLLPSPPFSDGRTDGGRERKRRRREEGGGVGVAVAVPSSRVVLLPSVGTWLRGCQQVQRPPLPMARELLSGTLAKSQTSKHQAFKLFFFNRWTPSESHIY